ncbi:MAG: hypothetical protein U0992_10335 [Planctomycetaceae bacterium]
MAATATVKPMRTRIPDQIGYINAHGTGTQLNDLDRTIAFKQRQRTRLRVPISSACMMGTCDDRLCSDRTGRLHPRVVAEPRRPADDQSDHPDDGDLDYVPHTAREVDRRHVLK